MTALPGHLDYDEANVPDEQHQDWDAYPLVRCAVPGCRWSYPATWDQIGDDAGQDTPTDWDTLHPAHGSVR